MYLTNNHIQGFFFSRNVFAGSNIQNVFRSRNASQSRIPCAECSRNVFFFGRKNSSVEKSPRSNSVETFSPGRTQSNCFFLGQSFSRSKKLFGRTQSKQRFSSVELGRNVLSRSSVVQTYRAKVETIKIYHFWSSIKT